MHRSLVGRLAGLLAVLVLSGCLSSGMWSSHELYREEVEVGEAARVTEVVWTDDGAMLLRVEDAPSQWPNGASSGPEAFLLLRDGPTPSRTVEVLRAAAGEVSGLRMVLVDEVLRVEVSRVGFDDGALLRPDRPFSELWSYEVLDEPLQGQVLELGDASLVLERELVEERLQLWSTTWRTLATPVTLAADVVLGILVLPLLAWSADEDDDDDEDD